MTRLRPMWLATVRVVGGAAFLGAFFLGDKVLGASGKLFLAEMGEVNIYFQVYEA